MSEVFAFVVGIDHYDQKPWPISGPVANAIAMVAWLRKIDVPPKNISLFVQTRDSEFDSILTELEAAGVVVTRNAIDSTIDRFWRETLPTHKPPDSRLFTYWSGHGFAEAGEQRLFICSDYTKDRLFKRVFHGTSFLTYLRSAGYQSFTRQIFLADVCGKYSDLIRLEVDQHEPPPAQKLPVQLGYFATPFNQFAKTNQGRGVFTELVLKVLDKFPTWPEETAFATAMRKAFEDSDQKPFMVEGIDPQGRFLSRLAGSTGSTFASIIALLKPLELSDELCRPHYNRTVSNLGLLASNNVTTLDDMVGELSSLNDRSGGSAVPRGLLQFVMRLQQEPKPAAAIEEWLTELAKTQAQDIVSVTSILQAERDKKLVLVEAKNTKEGDVDSFQVYVRTFDLRPVPDVDGARDVMYPERKVKGWDDFCEQLRADLRDVCERRMIEPYEIYFAVDSGLFDRKFHDIEDHNGSKLGSIAKVMLRYRERLRLSAHAPLRTTWRKYGTALRNAQQGALKLVAIPPPGVQAPINEQGMCYAAFAMPCSTASSSTDTKNHLQKIVLNHGMPYLFWTHDGNSTCTIDEVQAELQKLINESPSLTHVPELVVERRLRDDSSTCGGTLLWDDPDSIPFQIGKPR